MDTVIVAVDNRVPARRISETDLVWRGSHYRDDHVIGVIIDFRDEVKQRCSLVDRIARTPCGPGIVAIVEENRGRLIFDLARRGVHAWVPAPPTHTILKSALQTVVAETTVSAEIAGEYRSPGQYCAPLDTAESSLIRCALEPLMGPSEATQGLRQAILRVAASDMPVVLTGETGAGKQIVAEVIHAISPRREKRFVDVNVSGIATTVFESEFFGTVPGAYTGAGKRPGYFTFAHGGTLFLDEIGELPLAMQPKLLKVVENGHLQHMGSEESTRVDVRFMCATNRNISRMVAGGAFRSDLWNRIAAVIIPVPPLRERLQDMPFITASILRDKRYSGVTLKPDAIHALQQHRWRGNVRELKSVLERSIFVSGRQELRARDLVFDPNIGNHFARLI